MAKKSSPVRRRIKRDTPKTCYFCDEKKVPNYKDVEVLHRYITDRGKIMARSRSGVCAKHQRRLSLAIKHARHLALLPFLVRV